MQIESGVSLKPYNSFGLPAVAQSLVRIKSDADVRRVVDHPELGRAPKFILGGGSNIILSGKRIRGSEDNVRAAFLQGDHQVRSFSGHMQTTGKAQSFERLFLLEAFADRAKNGHFAFRPIHATPSALGLINVFDIVVTHLLLLLDSGSRT
jgi:hypothetical protein